jgi:hypothetical protein
MPGAAMKDDAVLVTRGFASRNPEICETLARAEVIVSVVPVTRNYVPRNLEISEPLGELR